MQHRPLFTAAIVLATMAASAVAQDGRFTINGRVKIEGGGLDDTKVVVYRNGEKDRVISNNLSRFSLDLDVNQSYTLSFEKNGFVTKKLSFDTHAPAEAIANGFTPFEFAVSLFKQYDDVNTVVFNQPVGMIRFDPSVDDFDYDTDYTKSIQSQLQRTMEEVVRKQEEEAAQAKEREKADAEAQRKAAEEAKEKARQEKEQAEALKKAEAERQKAEQAAKKAEEARSKEVPKPAPVVQAEAPRPKPAPVVKAEAPKPPPPPPPPPVVNTTLAKATEGSDGRRAASPRTASEESPVRAAKPVAQAETRPDPVVPVVDVARNEELIVEANQVITCITLATDAQKNEYRKVVRKYGGTYYFKNGQPCSQLIYESEALADR